MHCEYEKKGYFVLKQFYQTKELNEVKKVLQYFHKQWLEKHLDLYHKNAINSAFLTAGEILSEPQREVLFNFIGSSKLMHIVHSVLGDSAAFMNTQLFFNPFKPQQKNYWHRDTQYNLSIEEQKKALNGSKVLHFRIALEDERGLEMVPQSHQQWDTQEELNIRMELDEHQNSENLTTGIQVPLEKGDLLVFSANMIHRGLYGKERFAFDILFFESDAKIAQYLSRDCLPNKSQTNQLENNQAFKNSIELMKS